LQILYLLQLQIQCNVCPVYLTRNKELGGSKHPTNAIELEMGHFPIKFDINRAKQEHMMSWKSSLTLNLIFSHRLMHLEQIWCSLPHQTGRSRIHGLGEIFLKAFWSPKKHCGHQHCQASKPLYISTFLHVYPKVSAPMSTSKRPFRSYRGQK